MYFLVKRKPYGVLITQQAIAFLRAAIQVLQQSWSVQKCMCDKAAYRRRCRRV